MRSLLRIQIRAIREICSSHYTKEEIRAWSEVLKPGRYKKAISTGAFFVAVNGEAIVGFSNLNLQSGLVEAVYVDPEYVGLGAGMKLLQSLENVASNSGLNLLHLSASLNAVAFYERAGYKSLNHTRHLLPFGMVACVPMFKELSVAATGASE
jgi:GNAT superfamily N-acetyltransferase